MRTVVAGLVLVTLAAGPVACDPQAAAGPATTVVAQVTTTAPPTVAPTTAPTQAVPTVAPPTCTGPTGLDRVAAATIQIVAQGTFVDPEFGTQQNVPGAGSGFIINADGLAVTANHVVTGAATLQVFVPGQAKPVNARIVGASECPDLALIDLAGAGYSFLEFASAPPRVGTRILVAGYPLGEPESDWASVDHVLQRDAAATNGNSGGPVVTEDGKVVGIHYAARCQASQGFAIAAAEAQPVLDELKKGTNVDWIGINGTAARSQDGTISGIWVASVGSGYPADRAGVKPGDVVLELERLVLATDGTKKDYCDILRTKGTEKTMEPKVLWFGTDELLEGQLNGRPLAVTQTLRPATPTPPADGGKKPPAPQPTQPPADVTFVDVRDDTGRITAQYPDSWTTFADPVEGAPIINAAPDIENYGLRRSPARGAGTIRRTPESAPGSGPSRMRRESSFRSSRRRAATSTRSSNPKARRATAGSRKRRRLTTGCT
ncbi:MAG: trypsin-like peptidase domain-containing protein [Actinobacteria bacterium]|nr:trypsin-like peptidase domain-containing protein [Actinomycetota bacterium]